MIFRDRNINRIRDIKLNDLVSLLDIVFIPTSLIRASEGIREEYDLGDDSAYGLGFQVGLLETVRVAMYLYLANEYLFAS